MLCPLYRGSTVVRRCIQIPAKHQNAIFANTNGFKSLTNFAKKIHLKCLTGF